MVPSNIRTTPVAGDLVACDQRNRAQYALAKTKNAVADQSRAEIRLYRACRRPVRMRYRNARAADACRWFSASATHQGCDDA